MRRERRVVDPLQVVDRLQAVDRQVLLRFLTVLEQELLVLKLLILH